MAPEERALRADAGAARRQVQARCHVQLERAAARGRHLSLARHPLALRLERNYDVCRQSEVGDSKRPRLVDRVDAARDAVPAQLERRAG